MDILEVRGGYTWMLWRLKALSVSTIFAAVITAPVTMKDTFFL